jgi:hypothetical protein
MPYAGPRAAAGTHWLPSQIDLGHPESHRLDPLRQDAVLVDVAILVLVEGLKEVHGVGVPTVLGDALDGLGLEERLREIGGDRYADSCDRDDDREIRASPTRHGRRFYEPLAMTHHPRRRTHKAIDRSSTRQGPRRRSRGATQRPPLASPVA